VETPRRRKSEYDQAYYLRQESLEVGRAVSTFQVDLYLTEPLAGGGGHAQDTPHGDGGQAWWRESVQWALGSMSLQGRVACVTTSVPSTPGGRTRTGGREDKRMMVLRKWLREKVIDKVKTIKEIVLDRPQLQQVWWRAGGEGGGRDLLAGGQYGGWEQQVDRMRK
jgi:hypothetical protein